MPRQAISYDSPISFSVGLIVDAGELLEYPHLAYGNSSRSTANSIGQMWRWHDRGAYRSDCCSSTNPFNCNHCSSSHPTHSTSTVASSRWLLQRFKYLFYVAMLISDEIEISDLSR